jgi:alpha-glucosidase (family GH31 glycosyl hydrolase)
LREQKTGQRGLVLARWGGIGSHRYPVQFSGDTPSEWEALRFQIEFTARSANLAAAYWSHDIGGFFGREIDEELFIRWSQFGAMSPVFRTHSDHGTREPWKFSATAKKLFRKQTHIRYALAPYFYTLAYEAHETGLPLIRPLYLEYNDNDGGALHRKHQYTIGTDLLVIPADGPAPTRGGVFRKRAYFPNGVWYALETAEVRHGMEDTSIDIPLERIPTYVRRGAILPCQPVGTSLGTEVPEEIHFDWYPDPDQPSALALYEDDGESRQYESGRFAITTVKARQRASYAEVTISAPKGRYRGMPKSRTYVVRIRLEETDRVARVEAAVGKSGNERIRHRHTQRCLAGTVTSGQTFCEATVESANQPVRLRFTYR